MGRRIQGQRRGRGGPTFRAPSHRYKAELSHKKSEDTDTITGEIVDIEHDPARSAPLADVEFEDGDRRLILAPEGVTVGETIQVGVSAEIKPGNTLPIGEIPEGVLICNVESSPGDGGKFARATGVSAQLMTHDRNVAVIQLPSGQTAQPRVPCHDRRRRRRWPHREAVCQGWQQTSQDEGSRDEVPPRPWCCDERHRPPLRWRWPPTPRQAEIGLAGCPAGTEGRRYRLETHRPWQHGR